jgi:hypothetical protein
MTDHPPPKSAEELERMLSFGGDENDRKRASFRLMGPLLDPEAVTRETGLPPDVSHRKGDPHIGPRGRQYAPWPNGMWKLSSEQGLSESGNRLDDHLSWLLDRLEPHVHVLRRFRAAQQLTADFYCGYFMGQSNSGFDFSDATLKRIVALGLDASVGIDIYGENADRELDYWLKEAADPADSD